MTHPSPPLAGLKVLDLSRVLAGPVCTQVLADLGADVVKVERPGSGDDTRHWGPPFAAPGLSAYFLSCNRGKRSMALDLANEAAGEVLSDLVRQADVMVENFLPASVQKLGLLPERLQQINPNLVTCSISGYGRTGPWAELPGYDLVVQAMSGLMSITGQPDGEPMKVGVAISDVITGLYAAISVLAGLHARGKGSRHRWAFDLSLLDCTLASLVNVAQSTLLTGQRPIRYGNAHPQIVPYQALPTSDGHLIVAVGNDRQFQRLCQAAGCPALGDDPRFRTNPLRVEHRAALAGLLEPIFAARTTDQWRTLLSQAEVPHAPVLHVDESLEHPQVAAREMVVEVQDTAGRRYRLLNSPVHWPQRDPSVAAPPELGQHTDEVLSQWLGYDAPRIADLRQSGLFGSD